MGAGISSILTAEIAKKALRTLHPHRFKVHTNPQGWLPHCRPDGLRWQGIVQRGWAAGECRYVRMMCGLDSILIQATEGTEDTEKWKNALRTQCTLRF